MDLPLLRSLVAAKEKYLEEKEKARREAEAKTFSDMDKKRK